MITEREREHLEKAINSCMKKWQEEQKRNLKLEIENMKLRNSKDKLERRIRDLTKRKKKH